jgi:phage terminase large subunit-like protein
MDGPMDPVAFRAQLEIQTSHGRRPLVECLDDWQVADFEAADNGLRAVVGLPGDDGPTFHRVYRERPRGHSKSSDAAVELAYMLFASEEMISGVVCAGDADQAALLRAAVDKLVRSNDFLISLRVDRTKIVNEVTGSECQIIASDAPTSYGLLCDFILIDELVHHRSREMFDSLLSAAAKRENCFLSVASNCGWRDHWSYEVREAIRGDHDWHFSTLPGPVASWITPKLLAEQQRLLPSLSYARLWANTWILSSGDALSEGTIQAAIKLDGPTYKPEKGWSYFAGVDLGISRDASALAVVAKHVGYTEETELTERPPLTRLQEVLIDLGQLPEPDPVASYQTIAGTGAIKLVALRVWQPTGGAKVDLGQVESALLELHNTFRLAGCAIDPWQAELLLQRLQRQGVPARSVAFTSENVRAMAQSTLDSFNERQISLWGDAMLLADLRSLRVKETGVGVRLISTRGTAGGSGHGDAAQALQLALLESKRHESQPTIANNGEPLICWP